MINHYDEVEQLPMEDLLDAFERIDSDATERTYTTSTVEMSRMMHELDPECSERRALRVFTESFAEEAIIKHDDDGNVLGFVLFRQNDPYFSDALSHFTPSIAVNFSGVVPEHQEQGVWTEMRDHLRERIAKNRDVQYIVTGASKENHVSKEANKSRGFREVKSVSSVPGDDETVLLVKDLN